MNKTSGILLYIAISLFLHSFIFGFDRLLSFLLHKNNFSVKQAPTSIIVVSKEKRKLAKEALDEEIQSNSSLIILKKNNKTKVIPKPKELNLSNEKSHESSGANWEEDPALLQNPAPLYPDIARKMNWQGIVYLRIAINSMGIPTYVEVAKTSTHKVLDESAKNTIMNSWKFYPAKIAGVGVESTVLLPIRFQITANKD